MNRILSVIVNGEKIAEEVDPELSLLDFLRNKMLLTGVKKGCGRGECGACTVIMNGKAVTSCIIPVMRAMDASIQTVEGLSDGHKLHPIQEEFISCGAIQCGFCTPGMLMSAKALLDEEPNPDREQVKEAIGGNICRCTGYKKIEQAILGAAERLRKENKS